MRALDTQGVQMYPFNDIKLTCLISTKYFQTFPTDDIEPNKVTI